MFEVASRKKFRFQTKRGMLSTEDLWDIPLVELDVIAREMNRQKSDVEVSFITPVRSGSEDLDQMFELVKYIIGVRIKERDDRLSESRRAAERQRIMEIIDRKQNEALESLSIEELREMQKSI